MPIEVPTSSDRNLVVIKVGTSSLATTEATSGIPCLDKAAFQRIGAQVIELHKDNDVVIVTSGAIAAGMGKTRMSERPNPETQMEELQRLASVGNINLLNAWQSALGLIVVGGLLLTRLDLERRDNKSSSAINTICTHLSHCDVPVINENDAIATEEIKFGDNDTLSAIVAAQLKHAYPERDVKLVLLSDVDGLYERPGDSSSRIKIVTNLEEVAHFARGAGTENGTGGMVTKIAAAKIATQAGVHMWIANGQKEAGITGALAGSTGTHFIPFAAQDTRVL